MSPFWSAWVIGLIVLNLGISFFLLLWGTRVKIPTLSDGTTGHTWAHGVLREGVRKLPMWWFLLSLSMFAAAAVYLVLYPGFGSFKGTLGWTSHGELARDAAGTQTRLATLMQHFSVYPVEKLATDQAALQIGRRLFDDNCAACHGRAGLGDTLLGAPNLADDDWLYGGDGNTLIASITQGRHGVMPAWGPVFGETGVTNLANYVLSLSGAPHDAAKAATGKAQFAVCAACHGANGQGNKAMGAPDLADKIWLYGGDLATVEATIRNGRGGVMPGWSTRLSADQIRVVAAYVYSLSHPVNASEE